MVALTLNDHIICSKKLHPTFCCNSFLHSNAVRLKNDYNMSLFFAAAKQSSQDNNSHSSSSSEGDDDIESRVRARVKDLGQSSSIISNDVGKNEGGKARLARATAALIAKRKKEEAGSSSFNNNNNDNNNKHHRSSFSSTSSSSSSSSNNNNEDYDDNDNDKNNKSSSSFDLINLTKKIDQKILTNNWSRTGQRRRLNDKTQAGIHLQHNTDSMQSLLGYNHFEGSWDDRNSTTYHVAIVFGKPLIRDQVTIEYATRLRTLVKMLKDEPTYHPSLICFTGGYTSNANSISDASAGYVYFRHLCNVHDVTIDDTRTKIWVDVDKSSAAGDERGGLERIASELWRNYIKQWLKERPLTERLNQHCKLFSLVWFVLCAIHSTFIHIHVFCKLLNHCGPQRWCWVDNIGTKG